MVIARTPGNPKIPDVPNVKGVSSIEKAVKELVKCKINKTLSPIIAEVSNVLKNFFVLKAKTKTVSTAIHKNPITM